MFTSIAAVPASTRRSASLSATLYAPNQVTPQNAIAGRSRRAGTGSRRTSTTKPSAMLAIVSRPSASASGES